MRFGVSSVLGAAVTAGAAATAAAREVAEREAEVLVGVGAPSERGQGRLRDARVAAGCGATSKPATPKFVCGTSTEARLSATPAVCADEGGFVSSAGSGARTAACTPANREPHFLA